MTRGKLKKKEKKKQEREEQSELMGTAENGGKEIYQETCDI